ncbi:MAG: hypothetical protein AAF388_08525 [Bacteroidota bacterium]
MGRKAKDRMWPSSFSTEKGRLRTNFSRKVQPRQLFMGCLSFLKIWPLPFWTKEFNSRGNTVLLSNRSQQSHRFYVTSDADKHSMKELILKFNLLNSLSKQKVLDFLDELLGDQQENDSSKGVDSYKKELLALSVWEEESISMIQDASSTINWEPGTW